MKTHSSPKHEAKRKRKNSQLENRGNWPIGFKPVDMYVEMLEERYMKVALFCYDALGGDVIGVRWIPEAFLPQPLDPLNSAGHVPLGQTKELLVIPDIQTIMQDMWEMGNGLVVDIQVL